MENISEEDIQNNVSHPKHYSRWKELAGVEVIDITRHLDNDLGNVCKYVMRAGFKDNNSKLQDLLKAKWYLEDEINNIMGFKEEETQELTTLPVYTTLAGFEHIDTDVSRCMYLDSTGNYRGCIKIDFPRKYVAAMENIIPETVATYNAKMRIEEE